MSQPDVTRPNYEYLPEMTHSPAYSAFAANPNFPDGMTLRPPVPGTIARGDLPLRYQSTPEDARRAGAELANPFPASDIAATDRGNAVFTNFCAPCHGVSGQGNGPVAARGFPPPPSLFAETAVNMKDGQMFHVLSFGQGNMASYAAQIAREDRWKVILYVRSLQAQEARKAEQLAAVPAAATPDAPAPPGRRSNKRASVGRVGEQPSWQRMM
ncbi:MAG: c-type cytochrome [Acidobacteria bacterium]|nr:c-type cytochrome [Acidobacteriota bacterium]